MSEYGYWHSGEDVWKTAPKAIDDNNVRYIERLLKRMPKLSSHWGDGRNTRTILSHAVLKGRTEIVCLMLEKDPSVNLPRAGDYTPLADAIRLGHAQIVALLFAKGAKRLRRHFGIVHKHLGLSSSYDVLRAAVDAGHVEVVKVVFDRFKGKGLNRVIDTRNGPETIFVRACERGHVEVARFLLLAGADYQLVEWDDTKLSEEDDTQLVEWDDTEMSEDDRIDMRRRDDMRRSRALLKWWKGQLELPYLVHRAKTLRDEGLRQATTTQVPTYLRMPWFIRWRTIPLQWWTYLRARPAAHRPLPHVDLVDLPEDQKADDAEPKKQGAPKRGLRRAAAEVAEGASSGPQPSDGETHAVLRHVIERMPTELYVELMAGLDIQGLRERRIVQVEEESEEEEDPDLQWPEIDDEDY